MNMSLPPVTYVPRAQERQILEELDEVRRDHQSRAILLYGPGGVGKTSMVRQMSQVSSDDHTEWLEPIDVDDPECWLLSNLEHQIATRLDPDDVYFGEFQRQLEQLPASTHADISHETIVSHLNRIKKVFFSCYEQYAGTTGKTVVVVFDTVETIRGTNLLLTLTQWMKALPWSTLFILCGRPVTGLRSSSPDPIEIELKSRHQGMEVAAISVGEFSRADTDQVIAASDVAANLQGDERAKLILLTGGHPLWIDFTIDYLRVHEMPQEVTQSSLAYLEEQLPYDDPPSQAGSELRDAFLRRLVAPYRETDFWHETVNRLAVIRQPVATEVWRQLMSDYELPDGLSTKQAWDRLISLPWIRARSNGNYLTLHDAVAEEFAIRLFPLNDVDQAWRHWVWRRALEIYRHLVSEADVDLAEKDAAQDDRLRQLESRRPAQPDTSDAATKVISDSIAIDARRKERDQYRAASLYYLFLTDYPGGCQELLTDFERAEQDHNPFLQDLLVVYLQRFLPEGTYSGAFNDVIRAKLEDFQRWLTEDRPDLYVDLGGMVAQYLISSAQSELALQLLGRLPMGTASPARRHRIMVLSGNACLRIAGRVTEGSDYFEAALTSAREVDSPDGHILLAEAYNELGFYHRNIGKWLEAEESYERAYDAISRHQSAENLDVDQSELASILTNSAYVKGLNGSYREGTELAESAIDIRRKLELFAEEGLSWSVLGEVHRYAERYPQAWAAYELAERRFESSDRPDRLGIVYQEQAICLFQAYLAGVPLIRRSVDAAKKLIVQALDICQEKLIRGYPSALNRAGRIFGYDDPNLGLSYLKEGIEQAWELRDGWFWYANLVEFAELNHKLWEQARQDGDEADQRECRLAISGLEDQIAEARDTYSFPDLEGRWGLLQAHLAVDDYLTSGDQGRLEAALAGYRVGFALVSSKHVGSSGAASVGREFAELANVVARLPERTWAQWRASLRAYWGQLEHGSTLLARLDRLS